MPHSGFFQPSGIFLCGAICGTVAAKASGMGRMIARDVTSGLGRRAKKSATDLRGRTPRQIGLSPLERSFGRGEAVAYAIHCEE